MNYNKNCDIVMEQIIIINHIDKWVEIIERMPNEPIGKYSVTDRKTALHFIKEESYNYPEGLYEALVDWKED